VCVAVHKKYDLIMALNILTIPAAHGLLTPLSGAQSRLFHLVKRLKSLDTNIVILEDEHYSNSQERELVTPYYFNDIYVVNRHLIILRDINIHFLKRLFKVLKNENIDIIEFSYPAGMLAARCIMQLLGKRIPIIYCPMDFGPEFLEVLFRDPKYTPVDRRLLRTYIHFTEWLACAFLANHVVTVSERDRELFIKNYHFPRSKTSVIPSGSDLTDFDSRLTSNTQDKRELGIGRDKIAIFFHGGYPHPANKEAFDIINSYIAPKFEDDGRVLFVLAGTKVPTYSHSNVRSIGFIQDLPNALANVDIAIVPVLRGGGTRLKVFDYMAARLPIVTTEKGVEGTEIVSGEQAIIVDSVGDEFVEAIKLLVDNEEERRRLGSNARSLVEQRYSWDEIGDSLHAVYEQLLLNS
jgi:polysaccharide biosynthesis protein PslH